MQDGKSSEGLFRGARPRALTRQLWVSSAEEPPPAGKACSPLFQAAAADLPTRGHGAVSLPSSEFTSASLGAQVKAKQWARWSARVGPALLVTKTNTSCCPRGFGEDRGSRGLEKKEKGAAEKASCRANASVLTACQELNIAPVRGRAGGGHLGRLLCVFITAGAGNPVSFMPKRRVQV